MLQTNPNIRYAACHHLDTMPIGKTSKKILQVGSQWPAEKIPLAACRPICRLQIANVTPVLDVLRSGLANFTEELNA